MHYAFQTSRQAGRRQGPVTTAGVRLPLMVNSCHTTTETTVSKFRKRNNTRVGELPVSLAGDNGVALAESCLIPEVCPADVGFGNGCERERSRPRGVCPVCDRGEKQSGCRKGRRARVELQCFPDDAPTLARAFSGIVETCSVSTTTWSDHRPGGSET